ncbi:hypothetical protein ACFL0H_11605 [Thermodesulfobacteriota bacterium]
MDLEKEIKLLELARQLEKVNTKILDQREKIGKEDLELRSQFSETRDNIIKILAKETPLDSIRDPLVRETLRNVRDGDYYQLDVEAKNFEKAIKRIPPERVENFMRRKGITVSENEVDEYLSKMMREFQAEIIDKIDPDIYFERKDKFSTIISNKQLQSKINCYFLDVRESFLFGQFYAVMGLCRVLIEIAFRDWFVKLRLGNRGRDSKVHDLDGYINVKEAIRKVSGKFNDKELEKESLKLYSTFSKILHGKDAEIPPKADEVLDFARRTFRIIERLYE